MAAAPVVPIVAMTAHASSSVEQLRAHAELVVDRNLAQFELEQLRGLVGDGVRMLGAEDDASAWTRGPRNRERRQHSRRRGVLDVAVQLRRQPEELREPVEGHFLELLERGRRPPEDPDLIERGDQELGEDAGLRCGGREVREEAGALPVREPWHEHRIEVA